MERYKTGRVGEIVETYLTSNVIIINKCITINFINFSDTKFNLKNKCLYRMKINCANEQCPVCDSVPLRQSCFKLA